ncbi:hypothetical protein RSAG8_08010, partial [Rhizoctonia solani AG-8 WAC10335]
MRSLIVAWTELHIYPPTIDYRVSTTLLSSKLESLLAPSPPRISQNIQPRRSTLWVRLRPRDSSGPFPGRAWANTRSYSPAHAVTAETTVTRQPCTSHHRPTLFEYLIGPLIYRQTELELSRNRQQTSWGYGIGVVSTCCFLSASGGGESGSFWFPSTI